MSAIRSQLRAEVFNALDDKSATKPKPANETILVNELILEYLKYNNYHYAAMILKAGELIPLFYIVLDLVRIMYQDLHPCNVILLVAKLLFIHSSCYVRFN